MLGVFITLCLKYFKVVWLADVPILYPLKTTENQIFSCVFRGHKMGTLARNGPEATLLKETLLQVFYCEFCEISKNNFSCRTLNFSRENYWTSKIT